ncbi:membrane protein insertase YidC [Pseudonocardia humida]|uniref:Membrane protein insertase YidC n=1 Tax=Pseudonocardia humida TaxID=2800819 RepID=A0ABT1A622_9PSEU|nr:membrane protein insertase YidC [Pseudonocardia humida]MCO1658465.1 membrane protein insertase YidC [Pseudonocardia humida]
MLDPLYYAVSAPLWLWHQLFAAVLGPSSGPAWALSVVFLVLTVRALMIRLFLAQVRSGRAMAAIAPQLAELRRRHRDDPARLLARTRALQAEHGVSTGRALLPALLQAPVFLGVLHVLNGFNRPGLSFAENAAIANYAFGPAEVRSFLEARLFGSPLSAYLAMPQELLDSFGAPVARLDVVLVAVPLLLLSALATHLTARATLRRQPPVGPTAAVARALPWVFPLGVVVGGVLLPFPVAIGVYWLTTNAWTLVQQHLAHRALDRTPPPAPHRAPVAAPRPGAKPVRRRPGR